jgi:cell fate regulator YaaT (PSP1 superfamily)
MSCTNCAKGSGGSAACGSNGKCGSGGCNKLEVHDWLSGIPLPGGIAPFDAVEVRFKNTRKAFYRNSGRLSLMTGDVVTVEALHGHDLGTVSLAGELVRAQMLRKGAGTDTYTLRKVLRKSSQEEIDAWHAARQREDEVLFSARRMGQEARMDVKLSDVEFQGDGQRATLYCTTEQHVDARELLRRLSDQFRVRVELKQIGARQEAARLGGIGPCGRELCCSTWLTDFRSVTTSAARYQQLALNPQKLTGLCGKLKCCLNYELDMYIEAIKSYPSPNAKLRTAQGTGTHMKTDIFTERMWYLFKQPGTATVMAGFPVETVRGILAQNKEGKEPEVDLNMAVEPAHTKPADDLPETDYANVIDGVEDLARFDSKLKTGGRKRGRSGKAQRRDPGTDQGQSPQRWKDTGPRERTAKATAPQRRSASKEAAVAKSAGGPRPDGKPRPGGAPKNGNA